MTLAERVTALREERGLNQKELADVSGITQATISRIESGHVEDLKAESLKSLASALRVTVDYLVGRTEGQSASDIADADPGASRLLERYAALTPAGQRMAREFVEFVYRREGSRKGLGALGRLLRARRRSQSRSGQGPSQR